MARGASGELISLTEYQNRIVAAIEYVESGDGDLQQEETSHLMDMFPSGLMVQDRQGEKIQADHQGLLRWAEADKDHSRSRAELGTHLKSLRDQLSWQESGGAPISGQAWEKRRRLLDDVYKNREFKHLKAKTTPPWKTYLEEFMKTLGNWLREHLGPLGPILPGKLSQYILFGFILILGGVLVVWILRSIGPIGWRWKQPKLRPSQEVKAPEKDWTTWREQARSKAQKGAFREAIRSLFLSVLMEGHHRGWWVYEPETTNREHLARLEAPVERRQALQKLIDLYEESWYGLGHPGREEFRKCEEWLQQMGSAPFEMESAPSKMGLAQ